MAKKSVVIIIVIAVIILFVSMSSKRAVAPTNTNIEEAAEDTTGTQETQAEAAPIAPLAIAISGNEFSYAPNTISAQVGQIVTVTYKNTGKYPHDFVVDELGVKSQKINAGGTDTFTFTPSKAGTFPFYCSLPNHKEKGMVGTIIVK